MSDIGNYETNRTNSSLFLRVPTEVMIIIGSNLVKKDKVELSSTCRWLRNTFFRDIFQAISIPFARKDRSWTPKIPYRDNPTITGDWPGFEPVLHAVEVLTINPVHIVAKLQLRFMVSQLHLFPNLRSITWRYSQYASATFLELYQAIRAHRPLKELNIHMSNVQSKYGTRSWKDLPSCQLTHICAPGFVLQDHLRTGSMSYSIIQEITVEDQAALMALLDVGTIPSLQQLAVKGHHQLQSSELQDLLTRLPNLQNLSIQNMKVIGEFDLSKQDLSLHLQRLSGPVSILRLIVPICSASLQAIDAHLDMSTLPEDHPQWRTGIESFASFSTSLSQCHALREFRILCGSGGKGYALEFLRSLPSNILRLLVKLNLSFYFTAHRTMMEEVATILRNKLSASNSLVITLRPEEMTYHNAFSSEIDSLRTALKIFDSYFHEVIKPWALCPKDLPLQEVRTMNYHPVSGRFLCIASGKEWNLLVHSDSPTLGDSLAMLGRTNCTVFNL
ncbi:hypothetical protein FRC19_010665 [Serendipita sp. 401]|nr:hypothetical protein FRC19_010665 [Serendipita sp. 401]